jgi:hypothetical protein
MAEDERKSENQGMWGGFAARMGRLRRAIPTLGFSMGAAAPLCVWRLSQFQELDFSPLKYIYYLKQRVVLFIKTHYEA